MSLSIDFLFGMAVGIIFADAESCAEDDIEWGMVILLGPIMFILEKNR